MRRGDRKSHAYFPHPPSVGAKSDQKKVTGYFSQFVHLCSQFCNKRFCSRCNGYAMAATSEGVAFAVAPLQATCKARVVGHMSCDAFVALLSFTSLGFAPLQRRGKILPKLCVLVCFRLNIPVFSCFRVFSCLETLCFRVFVFWRLPSKHMVGAKELLDLAGVIRVLSGKRSLCAGLVVCASCF